MHPIPRAAIVCGLLALAGSRSAPAASPPARVRLQSLVVARAVDDLSAVCPPGTLPDLDACVPIPELDEPGGEDLVALAASHHDKRGRFRTYDQIPRRPDRPADYDLYRYPIAPPPSGHLLMSGYDLDRPDDQQRRGRRLSHVGHGGVDLAQARGTEVHLLRLEHQEGDAQVLYVGKLFGTTVLTRHTLREGGRLRDYVALHGHLDGPAPGIAKGQTLADGALLGFVGDTASEGIVHLHYEVRRVRDGVDVGTVAPGRVMANEVTVVCDPRNVMPLR